VISFENTTFSSGAFQSKASEAGNLEKILQEQALKRAGNNSLCLNRGGSVVSAKVGALPKKN